MYLGSITFWFEYSFVPEWIPLDWKVATNWFMVGRLCSYHRVNWELLYTCFARRNWIPKDPITITRSPCLFVHRVFYMSRNYAIWVLQCSCYGAWVKLLLPLKVGRKFSSPSSKLVNILPLSISPHSWSSFLISCQFFVATIRLTVFHSSFVQSAERLH